MAKFLSRLPWWALYALSSFIYFLAYYVARHRRAVIRDQLARVFPDLPEKDRVAIHKRFLRNFCDVLVETLKSLSINWGSHEQAIPIGAGNEVAPEVRKP